MLPIACASGSSGPAALSRRRSGWPDAEDVNAASGDLHHEQHVQPPQRNRVDMEEVRREQPRRLRPQERTPARVYLAWRGPDPVDGEDTADGAGADPVATTFIVTGMLLQAAALAAPPSFRRRSIVSGRPRNPSRSPPTRRPDAEPDAGPRRRPRLISANVRRRLPQLSRQAPTIAHSGRINGSGNSTIPTAARPQRPVAHS